MNAARADQSKPMRLRAVLASWLLLMLSMPAFALGLGQIQVKSRPGQPLLAEIPIISSDPAELQGLQARLASPETFRRVGLEPPQGIVSDLQFTPAVDQEGRPVIRVTSAVPVQQAALTFLLEVDWGQGRLVREYSALIDAPRTIAAPIEPTVEAPTAAPAPLIQRRQDPEPASEPAPAPAPTAVAATPTPAPSAVATPPAPAPAAQAETPPAQVRPPAPGYGPVKRGETLARIASGMTGEYSLDQTMLALLRTNPEAFIGQDINRLREGAVLRAPGEEELSRYSASQATSMVREQIASWRQARRAQLQPATAAGAAEAETTAKPATARAPAAGRRVADARLEIAPPQSSAGTRAGTQSGASAGGEGEMLRQELQQTKETLAARDAEVQELKTRVAELEQLQKEQQQLISMKDSALANAQQRLASTNAAQQATPAQAPASPAQAQDGGSAWWWLLPLALLVGALGWWYARRRRPATPRPATGRVSESFAGVDSETRRDDEVPPAEGAAQAVPAAAPQWVGKAKTSSVATAPAAERVAVGEAPAWVIDSEPDAAQSVALNQAPAGRDRIELAQAYAQLGDRNTARSLLQEVIDGGDAKAREEAARALQMLS